MDAGSNPNSVVTSCETLNESLALSELPGSCPYLEMREPGGRADLRVTNCVFVSGGPQWVPDGSLMLGDLRRV